MPIIKHTLPAPINPRLPSFEEPPPPPCSRSRTNESVVLSTVKELKYVTILSEKCTAQQAVAQKTFTAIRELADDLKAETSPPKIVLLKIRLREELSKAALDLYEFSRCERSLGVPPSECLTEIEKFVNDSYKER